MFESVKESLVKWNAGTDERVKLQHIYISLALGLLLVAGIIGLMNRDLGQNILIVAILSAGMFLANAIVWALLQSALLARIPRRRLGKNSQKK